MSNKYAIRVILHSPHGVFYGKKLSEQSQIQSTMNILNNLEDALRVVVPLEDGTQIYLNREMIGRCLFAVEEVTP